MENLKSPVEEFDSVNMFYRKMTEPKWYFKINLNAANRKASDSKDPNHANPTHTPRHVEVIKSGLETTAKGPAEGPAEQAIC